MFALVDMHNLWIHSNAEFWYRLQLFMNDISSNRETGAIKNIQVFGRYIWVSDERKIVLLHWWKEEGISFSAGFCVNSFENKMRNAILCSKRKPMAAVSNLELKKKIWEKNFWNRYLIRVADWAGWIHKSIFFSNQDDQNSKVTITMRSNSRLCHNAPSIIPYFQPINLNTLSESGHISRERKPKGKITFKCLYLSWLQTTWKPYNFLLLTSY